MVKGLSFFSLFSDYFIEKELILWIWRSIYWRSSDSDGETKEKVSIFYCTPIPTFCNCGIDLTCDLTNKYTNYLCFTITYRTNKLVHYKNNKYTKQQQQENHDLIKLLHDGGMDYRKIAQYFNEKGIKTARRTSWVNTQVFSFLRNTD